MYVRSFGDVFSPAALIVRASFFVHLAPRVPFIEKFMPIQRYTLRRNLSDSKRDGCTVMAKVFTWSHSEPGSPSPSASLLVLWYESPRELKSLCPSLFTSGSSTRTQFTRARPAAFGHPTKQPSELQDRGRDEHMPIDRPSWFGSGRHLSGPCRQRPLPSVPELEPTSIL